MEVTDSLLLSRWRMVTTGCLKTAPNSQVSVPCLEDTDKGII